MPHCVVIRVASIAMSLLSEEIWAAKIYKERKQMRGHDTSEQ
jgi:hypothetical protein